LKPGPLRGKIKKTNTAYIEDVLFPDDVPLNYEYIIKDDVKSALNWMIQIHEKRIEELIKTIQHNFWELPEEYEDYNDGDLWIPNGDGYPFREYLRLIDIEYASIMILEEGLSDVV